MNCFSLSCTALLGTNKAGTLKPDADGYYLVVLGALDVYNSGGAFYPEASARHLFEKSSSLMRRIASGNLRGEYGHPRMQPGQTVDEFVDRVRDIYEQNVCLHIRKVTVDYTTYRTPAGKPMIVILGEIRPSGPRGPALKEQLDNRFEDVCFSIRSLTQDEMRFGRREKNLKLIVTWDYVNEPGLDQARKWNAPGLESFNEPTAAPLDQEITLLPGFLKQMAQSRPASAVAMESSGSVSLESLIEATTDKVVRPPSAFW